jgi:hypothetical protein
LQDGKFDTLKILEIYVVLHINCRKCNFSPSINALSNVFMWAMWHPPLPARPSRPFSSFFVPVQPVLGTWNAASNHLHPSMPLAAKYHMHAYVQPSRPLAGERACLLSNRPMPRRTTFTFYLGMCAMTMAAVAAVTTPSLLTPPPPPPPPPSTSLADAAAAD